MPDTVIINFAKSVASAKILENSDGFSSGWINQETHVQKDTPDVRQVNLLQDTKARKAEVLQICQVLKEIVDNLNEFYNETFTRHKEEIARLAVEIARKILMQDVEKNNYKIEAIVKEALENTPTRQDVVVHLNPKDLDRFQKLQQEELDKIGTLDGIKFVADSNIGRAECFIESPKGIIESLIDEHLERVSEALKKAK